jgi:hypothetical protein
MSVDYENYLRDNGVEPPRKLQPWHWLAIAALAWAALHFLYRAVA